MLYGVVCCLLFVVVRCSLSSRCVACLVVLCDDVVCRLIVVGFVSCSCLWCVGVVVVRRRCWLLLWLMGGVCVSCGSLLPGDCCLWFVVCRCSLLLSSLVCAMAIVCCCG